jgi:hypothetical protein
MKAANSTATTDLAGHGAPPDLHGDLSFGGGAASEICTWTGVTGHVQMIFESEFKKRARVSVVTSLLV